MTFTKRLREGVRLGFITSSIRIWRRPKVKVGGRYGMEEGEIVVDSIEQISLTEITQELAIESGFENRADLLSVAKHGPGENVYLIRFATLLESSERCRRRAIPGIGFRIAPACWRRFRHGIRAVPIDRPDAVIGAGARPEPQSSGMDAHFRNPHRSVDRTRHPHRTDNNRADDRQWQG